MRQQITTRIRDGALPIARNLRRQMWGDIDDTILVVQPDHLGDILLSQPAVRYLRDRHPASHLIAVVGPWSEEIADLAWPVDEIVTIAFPGFTRAPDGSPIAPYRQLNVEAEKLLAHRPRAAYVLRPDAWWAAWLVSLVAPVVTTADDPRSRVFATATATLRDSDHAATRAFRIASASEPQPLPRGLEQRLALPPDESSAQQARNQRAAHGVSDSYVVIHPGSGASVKEWPIARWQAVAQSIVEDGFDVVLTGTAPEAALCQSIASDNPRITSLAGETPLRVLIELLRSAHLVLGPDCGPLHLAAAVATKSIHLFGPSDPVRYGPWGNPVLHRVISANWSCPRCGDLSPLRQEGCGCMLAILPDDVLRVARELLGAERE